MVIGQENDLTELKNELKSKGIIEVLCYKKFDLYENHLTQRIKILKAFNRIMVHLEEFLKLNP